MRPLTFALPLLLGSLPLLADSRNELTVLRARCSEQERQIRTLESDIESLHSQLALERRRARGVHASVSPEPTAKASRACVVTTGDTLSSLARRHDTSVGNLMKVNGITDPTRLRIGQQLELPPKMVLHAGKTPARAIPVREEGQDTSVVISPPPSPQLSQAASKPEPDYTVQRGDTLYGIARRHKMTISTLRSLNPDIGDRILVGQKISVGGRTSPAVRLTEKKQIPSDSAGQNHRKLTSSLPQNVPVKASGSKEHAVAEKLPNTPSAKKNTDVKPASSVAAKSREIRNAVRAPKSISSVFVSEEVSFGDFAKRHGTTPEQLNALNGWDFRSSLVLAKGSEIYVPGS